jgi:ubiquinone/menaquinone biosynthesis C-methylase UbiE
MSSEVPRRRHRWFAAWYDFFDRMGDERLLPLRDRLVANLHSHVLEVGCGTGKNLEHYRWEQIASLEATEPDPFMLRRARERLARLDGDTRAKVRLTEAPAEALPFPDAQFDAVVSCLVLCTVAELPRALVEMRRVLKPGGELRLLEHVARDDGMRRVQGAVQPVYGWFSAGCRLDRRTEDAVRAVGFELEVQERTSFSPLHPAFLGVARKPAP